MNREEDSLLKWLVFSKSEKRGITFLLVLIVILITIRYIQKHWIGNSTVIAETNIEVQVNNNINSQNIKTDTSDSVFLITSRSPVAPGVVFDPNDAEIEDLLDQGIPVNIANRIINYRQKGGVFYEAIDLYKIYGIDSGLVEELVPWVEINATRPIAQMYTSSFAQSYPAKSEVKIEINSADSTSFCELYGIGPVLSRRIIRYRETLGGFRSTQQLIEVYGIDDSLYADIEINLTIDTTKINKLQLNSADFNELIRHPYLTSYEVKAILSYRRLIGPFISCDELVDNYILSENTYRKVRAYLSLN